MQNVHRPTSPTKGKSKSGCITCKIRKIKCDETQPKCKRCTSSRRECDGYLPQSEIRSARELREDIRRLGVVGPASRALSSPSPSPSSQDGVFFDLFRRSTVSSTEEFLPSTFWTRDVLQLSSSEPAVWHAAVALGAFHRQWDYECQDGYHSSGSGCGCKDNAQWLASTAMSHYGRALFHARVIREPARLFILSVMLQAIANIAGRWSESQTHGLAGLRLLKQRLKSGIDRPTARELSLLERLDIQAMLFSDSQAPYPYSDVASPDLVLEPIQWPDDPEDCPQLPAMLCTMFRRFILLRGALDSWLISAEQYHLQRSRLSEDLKRWDEKFSSVDESGLCCLKHGYNISEKQAVSLGLYSSTLSLLLEANLFGPESRWDQFSGHFERIISQATVIAQGLLQRSRSSISFEPTIIAPLFLTAFRCRHPQLRRRAIGLLRRLKRREAMWTGAGAAAVAERVMQVEEAGAKRQLSTSVDKGLTIDRSAEPFWIPESNRVRELVIYTDISARKVRMTLVMSSADENRWSAARHETVLI
ncbi:hypothetical protein F4779DRAFT_470735 [Xylariaceae sp. FL0662B]|nr:hypothetical protein F4779DRAFT_470735 [Xylariaceae sp. FL0662B]